MYSVVSAFCPVLAWCISCLTVFNLTLSCRPACPPDNWTAAGLPAYSPDFWPRTVCLPTLGLIGQPVSSSSLLLANCNLPACSSNSLLTVDHPDCPLSSAGHSACLLYVGCMLSCLSTVLKVSCCRSCFLSTVGHLLVKCLSAVGHPALSTGGHLLVILPSYSTLC
jgi:hypothetical protein